MEMSQVSTNNCEVTRNIKGPVKALRWNVKKGTFVLQYATDAVVFNENGQFLRLETIWLDVPIVDNAPASEPTKDEHISRIAADIGQCGPEE